MLRAALIIWCAGVLIFFVSVALVMGVHFLTMPPIWFSLLILALAAPIFITCIFVRRLELKQKALERRRKHLMEKFEEAMVKRVERIVGRF
jgi:membrane protein implicated in regulation of membrane protease activity